jgi:hypothetical protein
MAGQEDAISELACDYYFGRGTFRDYAIALEWLRKGIGINDGYCHNLFGFMSLHGIGVAIDRDKALFHLEQASELGHVHASRLIAALLFKSRKFKQAIKILISLAKNGDVESQFDLGRRYSTGTGATVSQDEAIFWYRKAADQNHPEALFRLASRYEIGFGLEKNEQLALTLYRRSAEAGFVGACEKLHEIYEIGTFGERSEEKSNYWTSEARKLKADADNAQEKSATIGLVHTTLSKRSQRLRQKRSLQRKAPGMISRD